MPMQRVGKKADALSKMEFHRRLREWLLTTGEEEEQIGPGQAPYILIYDDEKYYRIHADAKRRAVREYLSLVDLHGDSIKWSLHWTQSKKKPSKKLVKVGPYEKDVESLLLYSEKDGTDPVAETLTDESAADNTPDELSKLNSRQLVLQQI
jgi:hypothetical protein